MTEEQKDQDQPEEAPEQTPEAKPKPKAIQVGGPFTAPAHRQVAK